ncbi:MAG: type III-B CRISPR module RAMP protein Cmr6 [Candidatus Poribacteria bacterium]|nr:MAG: type III-B CRISPR module RAMP protein Cmr6 [Candidatus Poribacteria bacterium]
MSSRRQALEQVSLSKDPVKATHAGLWLDKYITAQAREDTEARRKLVEQVAGICSPEVYASWFRRWKKSLDEFGATRCTGKTAKGSRIAIGLGRESVLETSIALHRTFGVPYIPGSALKGLTASFVRQHLGWDEKARGVLFGTVESAGYVVFFDAMPVPPKEGSCLAEDVITVHHPEYYQEGSAPPADSDDPTPVPFLTATGEFLFALAGPKEWVQAAFQILQEALIHLGVGAKTSSGYGRIQLDLGDQTTGRSTEQVAAQSGPSQPAIRPQITILIRQVEALRSPSEVRNRLQDLVAQWQREENLSEEERRAFARAVVEKVRSARLENRMRQQPWYLELLALVEGEA